MVVVVYILLTISTLCALSLAAAALSLAPWVPCRRRDLPRIVRLAELKPGEHFFDIGCGDGRMVRYAAEHFAVHAVGIERALPLYAWCILKQHRARSIKAPGTVTFIRGNLFTADLSLADVVYVFGMPHKMAHALKKKMERELKQGCRIISYAFPIGNWKPDRIEKPSAKDLPIYRYRFPLA